MISKAMPEFSAQRRRAFLITGVVFVVILLVPGAVGMMYYQTDQNLTAQTYARQQTLINLAATAVRIKIDHLVGIAKAIASLDQISQSVASGRWDDAARSVSDFENNVAFYDPFIDRVIFYDARGIQRAAYPTLVGGIGTSATSSDWYRALNQGENSYVSGVAQRLSMPRINVVGVAVPIETGGAIRGFLVLQIPTNNFLEFGTDLSLGTYGFAYIVDGKGNLVANPHFSSQTGAVTDYSFVPAVKEIMAGKAGVMVANDPSEGEKSVISYEPLPQYRWGIVIQELYDEAFAARDSILFSYLWEIIAAIVIDLAFSYLIFRLLIARSKYPKS